ncbi:MAG: hypothetical protein GXY55_19250 [Phycisphaerae bacterium]|nr:hypothetical protein [Phycisphaerae bacterium]
MARRKTKAEGSFADAANHHGFKRARWRGLEGAGIQNLLIAAIQNLRKLVRAVFAKNGPPAAGARITAAATPFLPLKTPSTRPQWSDATRPDVLDGFWLPDGEYDKITQGDRMGQ